MIHQLLHVGFPKLFFFFLMGQATLTIFFPRHYLNLLSRVLVYNFYLKNVVKPLDGGNFAALPICHMLYHFGIELVVAPQDIVPPPPKNDKCVKIRPNLTIILPPPPKKNDDKCFKIRSNLTISA